MFRKDGSVAQGLRGQEFSDAVKSGIADGVLRSWYRGRGPITRDLPRCLDIGRLQRKQRNNGEI